MLMRRGEEGHQDVERQAGRRSGRGDLTWKKS